MSVDTGEGIKVWHKKKLPTPIIAVTIFFYGLYLYFLPTVISSFVTLKKSKLCMYLCIYVYFGIFLNASSLH